MTDTVMPDDTHAWVGAIITASGAGVDLLNFTPNMVYIGDIAQSISLICRYNGHIPTFYSVAEHSWRVSRWLEEQGYNKEIQLTGLLHDAAEAYVGDMVRPLKRVPEVGGIHQVMEDKISKVIHSVLGGIHPHPEPVHEADKQVYYWEVDNVRSGKQKGWAWDVAKRVWSNRYQDLTDAIRIETLRLSGIHP